MHWVALQPLHEPAPSGDADDPPDGVGPAAAQATDPQALADAVRALGWWALRFTPRVALLESARALLLEVSASERLFGGRRQLIARLLAEPRPVERFRMARGATALLALARLQLDPAARREPDQLPLHTLEAARPHLATLERLGCQCWGDLRALPRGGVVRRFGALLLDALDQAYGLKPEAYPWLVLPEVFDQPLELQAQVEAAPALLFAAKRLLAQLQVWLQARQRGVLVLELLWQMDARRDTATEGSLRVRTAVPTLDMVHLQRLLAENLERITLPAPVLYLRLRSIETAALSGASTSLLPDGQRSGDVLIHLLERLAARLGPGQVLRALPRADHRPECMQDWVPAQGGTAGRTAGLSDALYPTWLLTPPLRLAVRQDRPLYQGPLTLLAGPQRLEAAWWDVVLAPVATPSVAPQVQEAGPAYVRSVAAPSAADAAVSTAPAQQATNRLALRDYFLARSAQAGLLWIYRERLMTARVDGDKPAGQWYLHGVFG